MRSLEIASLIVTGILFLVAVTGRPQQWWTQNRSQQRNVLPAIILSAIAVLVPILSIVVHQSRLSMWPIYFTSFILAGYFLWRMRGLEKERKASVNVPRPMRIIGRSIIAVAVILPSLAAAAFTQAFPVVDLPAPTGAHSVGFRQQTFIDDSREERLSEDPKDKRTLKVAIYYPAESASAPAASLPTGYFGVPIANELNIHGPMRDGAISLFDDHARLIKTHSHPSVPVHNQAHPIIFYSPSYSPIPEDNVPLAEELASHGYIVVATNHPYTSSQTPYLVSLLEGVQENDALVTERAKDLSFLLDKMTGENALPSSPFFGKIDLNTVGVIGYSFGAATAVETVASDPRFDAAVAIDGSLYGHAVADGKEIPQSLLYITATDHANNMLTIKQGKMLPNRSEYQDEAESEWRRYQRIMRSSNPLKVNRWGATMAESNHSSFSYLSLLGPLLVSTPSDPREEVITTRTVALDFFNHTLRGNEAQILGKSGSYPRPLTFFKDPLALE
ncbi:MAG: hypothetical protein Q4C87_10835 [Actinomycetaceae bacterium]|nr:hypothetical protein [Actinomycetaceae bacterium]